MLSKFVSLTFRNSALWFSHWCCFVVNCFQNLYLWRLETANVRWLVCGVRCELLSKFVSLTFRNSCNGDTKRQPIVVNCFQNLYLWRLETAKISSTCRHNCCELLSKFVSLTFRNSTLLPEEWDGIVVNCFQNLYLWRLETALQEYKPNKFLLWIAFKICIFDVLSNITSSPQSSSSSVVICFQIVSLTYCLTSRTCLWRQDTKLWFAFKLYLWRIV